MAISYRLLENHVGVYAGGLSAGPFCGGTGIWDCDAVASHDSAWLLGAPVALWGVVYFVFILGLAVLAVLLRGEDRGAILAGAAIACGLGFLVDVYLAIVMATQIGRVCPYCVATYLINLSLFLVLWRLRRGASGSVHWRRLAPSLRAIREGPPADYYRELLKTSVFAGTVMGMALTLSAGLAAVHDIRVQGESELQSLLMRMEGPPDLDMARFAMQPTVGPRDAPVALAVAGDFQCPLCRSLANTIHALRRKYPDKIRVTFINFPASSECNPGAEEVLHPDACWLARGGECAHVQGKFWDYHDLLFQELPYSSVNRKRVLVQLDRIGLGQDRFLACLVSPEAHREVASDVAMLTELGISAVPTLVINGFAVRGSPFPWMLKRLVVLVLQIP